MPVTAQPLAKAGANLLLRECGYATSREAAQYRCQNSVEAASPIP